MSHPTFAGDKKVGTSLLGRYEKRLVQAWVGAIPNWLQTYHLTLLTLLWSGLALAFFVLAKRSENLHWLWAISIILILQYLTDLFDGAVGRHRQTGLIKWGFHMDHFLDYIFQSVLVIGYALLAPDGLAHYFLGLIVLTGGYMVNSFLCFAATNQFKISYFGIGPTELRLILILLNATIIFTKIVWWKIAVPVLFWILLITLCILVFKTQRQLWQLDMKMKTKQTK